jgi:hypothetical protein
MADDEDAEYKQQAAEYVHDMAEGLILLAEAAQLRTLRHLLDMTRLEAQTAAGKSVLSRYSRGIPITAATH